MMQAPQALHSRRMDCVRCSLSPGRFPRFRGEKGMILKRAFGPHLGERFLLLDQAMKQMRVRDIMTTKVITLPREATTGEAARCLTTHRVSGAPVVDRGRIVGVVSKTDLLDMRTRPSEPGDLTVDDVMTHLIFAVRPSDPAMLAVRLMVEEGIHRAVVVDEGGRLAGVISPMDVLRALARGEPVQDGESPVTTRETHAEPAVAVQYVDLREMRVSA
jgi:CBS domain-containing protein